MSISLHLRKKIADYNPAHTGQTVKQFCREHGISRQTFYNIKNAINEHGPSGIHPESTAPKQPSRRFETTLAETIITARAWLKQEGRDYGPWSSYYYLIDEHGLSDPPSRSTIAKILHEHDQTDKNARKRPRSSYKRFARSKAGELWQIDAMVYTLFDRAHSKITIYQIIDDATRLDVGTRAFKQPENGHDARKALQEAFDQYGLPQELLSDNSEAFTAYHRGILTATDKWLTSFGVLPIAGFNPTTQGKNERSHSTLRQWLNQRKPASVEEANQAVDDYRTFYNTRRRHQSLLVGKFHITPAEAWRSWPHATPPTQPLTHEEAWARIARYQKDNIAQTPPPVIDGQDEPDRAAAAEASAPEALQEESADQAATETPSAGNPWGIPEELTVDKAGVVTVTGERIYIGLRFHHRQLVSVVSEDTAEFYTAHDGELLFSVPLPLKIDRRYTSQINIGYIPGAWHRQPPQIRKRLEGRRPARKKK